MNRLQSLSKLSPDAIGGALGINQQSDPGIVAARFVEMVDATEGEEVARYSVAYVDETTNELATANVFVSLTPLGLFSATF